MVLDEFELRFDWIEWRQPIKVVRDDRTWLACRLCIARFGLKGREIETTPFCFTDQDGFDAHILAAH